MLSMSYLKTIGPILIHMDSVDLDNSQDTSILQAMA